MFQIFLKDNHTNLPSPICAVYPSIPPQTVPLPIFQYSSYHNYYHYSQYPHNSLQYTTQKISKKLLFESTFNILRLVTTTTTIIPSIPTTPCSTQLKNFKKIIIRKHFQHSASHSKTTFNILRPSETTFSTNNVCICAELFGTIMSRRR